MLDIIRRSFLTSLGLAVVSREKVRQISRDLVESGKLTKEEADQLVSELIDEGKKEWQELREKVDEMAHNWFTHLDLSSKTEFTRLQEQVDNIENRLKIYEDRLAEVEKDRDALAQ